jgi:hypothetical protein
MIESLRSNALYEESEKFVFIDGPRNDEDRRKIQEVLTIALEVTSNVSVSAVNKGLGHSIISGVSAVIEKYGKAIVLEDDLICTPNFLSYMNQALDFYEQDQRIISVCGYGLKIKRPKNYDGDVYLSGRSSSWGWATWRDRWKSVDWEVRDWAEFSHDCKKIKEFNKNGSDMFSMLKGYMEGKNRSWAIRFCYNQYKTRRYSVCPFLSKVDNDGFGEDATNCKQKYSRFKVNPDKIGSLTFAFVRDIKPNRKILRESSRYHSIRMRAYSRIRNMIGI